MVEVTVQLPEDVAQQLAEVPGDIPRRVLEAIALEGYRANKLTRRQVGGLLHLDTKQTEQFLAEHAGQSSSPGTDPSPPDLDWEAFRRALPGLLQTERGRFVAVSRGQVVDCDADEYALVERVSREHPGQKVLIQRVTEELDEVHIDTPELEFLTEPKR